MDIINRLLTCTYSTHSPQILFWQIHCSSRVSATITQYWNSSANHLQHNLASTTVLNITAFKMEPWKFAAVIFAGLLQKCTEHIYNITHEKQQHNMAYISVHHPQATQARHQWPSSIRQHTALYPGLPGWAGTGKVKTTCILLKQETASCSGISWPYASLHLAPDRQHASTLPLSFLGAGCPSCRPTNSNIKKSNNMGLQNKGRLFFNTYSPEMLSAV